MVKVQRLFAKTNLKIQVCRSDKSPLGTKGRTSILSYREYVRPAELHSRSAEEIVRPRMFRHFVPSRELHSLATLVRLSLVDLPSANSMKCCSPPASLKKQNTENQTVDWSHYAKSRRSYLCALKDFSTV